MVQLRPGVAVRGYYHLSLIYISGGRTSYLYELNKAERTAEDIALKIHDLVPDIRFDGARVFPKRVHNFRVFVSDSFFDQSSNSLREEYPEGYPGNFGGTDVTLEITEQAIKRADEESDFYEDYTNISGDIAQVFQSMERYSKESSNLFDSFRETIQMDEPQARMYEKMHNRSDTLEYDLKNVEESLKEIHNTMVEHNEGITAEFERDRAPVPYALEKAIINFYSGRNRWRDN